MEGEDMEGSGNLISYTAFMMLYFLIYKRGNYLLGDRRSFDILLTSK